jgi:hypothetical protein
MGESGVWYSIWEILFNLWTSDHQGKRKVKCQYIINAILILLDFVVYSLYKGFGCDYRGCNIAQDVPGNFQYVVYFFGLFIWILLCKYNNVWVLQ